MNKEERATVRRNQLALGRELEARCASIIKSAEHVWYGEEDFETAVEELDIELDVFYGELDRNPTFANMPQYRDDFDGLWGLFLHRGEPGQEYWRMEEMKTALGSLTVDQFFIALAGCSASTAKMMFHEHQSAFRKNDLGKGFESLRMGRKCLQAAEKALAFAMTHGCCRPRATANPPASAQPVVRRRTPEVKR